MAATRRSYEEAKASLACEGIHLNKDEDRLIGNLIDQGTDANEGAERIKAWLAAKMSKMPSAAE